MKRIVRFLGIVVIILILMAVGFALFINFRGIPSYDISQVITVKVVSTPEKVERGRKLAMMLCAGCHKNYETGRLTGSPMLDAPPEFGNIFSANITQDKTYGIGDWTDGEIMYLLRTGVKRDGKYAPPYMAKLPHMADEDIESVIAFLRSDDPSVAADPTPDQPCEPSFLTKFLCNVAFKPFDYPDHRIELPDTNDQLALGKYLATNLECFSCHSADFKTNNYLEPEKSPGFYGGGNMTLNLDGKLMLTLNLTPDNETGIGTWSEEKFVKALKTGVVEGDEALRYPMLPYTQLSDKEAAAIYQYLRTVPTINHKVERSVVD